MSSVIEVNEANWDKEVLKADLVIVDFWHNQCPWCLKLAPNFEEVSKEYEGRVKFAKIDILESSGNQGLAERYGVMGTPTLVIFCRERSIGTIPGFQTKEALRHMVNHALDNHNKCIAESTDLKNMYA